MQQASTQIASLPLALVLVSNGCVALQKMAQQFKTIIDQHTDGVSGIISEEDLSLVSFGNALASDKAYEYNKLYELSQEPLLKQWLIQQDLQQPY
jgi:hypothetical protein